MTKQACPSAGLQPRNRHDAGADIREGEEAADAGSGRAQDFPLGPAAALN